MNERVKTRLSEAVETISEFCASMPSNCKGCPFHDMDFPEVWGDNEQCMFHRLDACDWMVKEALEAQNDAKPRAGGEWRESGDGFFDFVYCSLCGHKERRETSLPPLCPACGAKMAQ